MDEMPKFFFSHARKDREAPGNYLRRFFTDLEFTLTQWTKSGKGTIDARVPQTANWDAELSAGLGNNKVFIAILTPFYFDRVNCGKELGVFLLRSPNLGIDGNGSLTGVKNVMLIRWLRESAYTINIDESVIPPILRLIEDSPAEDLTNPARTRAIKRYRQMGMQNCVRPGTVYYSELVDAFVETIRNLPHVPAASGVSFSTAIDAFRYDWSKHFKTTSPATKSTSISGGSQATPSPLTSIVVFYVTHQSFKISPIAVDFADVLVAEAPSGVPSEINPVLGGLLADIRAAATADGYNIFHAATNPPVPPEPSSVLSRLARLSSSQILPVLVVDSDIWPKGAPAEQDVVGQIIRSRDWNGLVVLFGSEKEVVDKLSADSKLPHRLVFLPEGSEERINVLRSVFVEGYAHLWRTTTVNGRPSAEPPPRLQGPRAQEV